MLLMLKKSIIAGTLALSGCAHVAYPNVSQPRALGWGSSIPSCLIFCAAHTTITDAESGAATSTVTSTETVSPSMAVGVGGGAGASSAHEVK